MFRKDILDLKTLVKNGMLYKNLDTDQRVEALIPTIGYSNHASQLLTLSNGDLFCCWMAGSYEGHSGMNIVGSILPHQSIQWSPCFPIATDSTHSLQNPVPFQAGDGILYVFYTSQETRNCTEAEWREKLSKGEVTGSFTMQFTAVVMYVESTDLGKTWSAGKTFFSKQGSFIRQRLVALPDNTLLFPIYYSGDTNNVNSRYGNDYSVVKKASGISSEWKEIPVPGSRGRVHMSVVNTATPNKLVAFFRSRSADRIYRAFSLDCGENWSAPERTILPNNNASIMAIGLQSGRIAVIFNHYAAQDENSSATVWPSQRHRLTLALSEDEGITWPYMRMLECGDGFFDSVNDCLNREISYPAIIQDNDGAIHCSYTFAGRLCIKYARVDEPWIMGSALRK